jgi:hypothetical protein
LIVCLLAAAATLVTPGNARAEWRESNLPCGVVPGAILPAPLVWIEPEEEWSAWPRYFTDSDSSFTNPPATQFTATANWGDGTTGPATVQASSGIGGCYIVAAVHTYANPGLYTISYLVHDSATNRDHVMPAAQQLRVLSPVPQLVSTPSIDARTGVPWEGVVAHFKAPEPFATTTGGGDPSKYYTATIEWTDALPEEAATVVDGAHPFVEFDVRGSHVYNAPFIGSIGVHIFHAGRLLGRWEASSVNVEGPHSPGAGPATRGGLVCGFLHARVPYTRRRGGPRWRVYVRGASSCGAATRALDAVMHRRGKDHFHGSESNSYFTYHQWTCAYGQMGSQSCRLGPSAHPRARALALRCSEVFCPATRPPTDL